MEHLIALGMPILLLVWSYDKPIMNGFFIGVYFHSGLSMTHQDWVGLEAYHKYLDENWVDFHWGVGATLAIIAFAFYVLQSIRFVKYNRERN